MQIYLLRHGQTAWNAARRYQGNQDIPLSAEGRAALRRADFSPARVYVSPLMRARQTAAVLFPQAEQIVVPDLREMNFGSYEGRPYINIEEDAEFLAWEQKNAASDHPDGERRADFCRRSCAAFAGLVEAALAGAEPMLAIVAHGGTQAAVMERFAFPHRSYLAGVGPNAGGYLLQTDAARWQREHSMEQIAVVQYTRKVVAGED